MEWVLLVVCVLLCVICVILAIMLFRSKQNGGAADDKAITQLQTALTASQQTAAQQFEQAARLMREEQKTAFASQEEKLVLLGTQTQQHLAEERHALEVLNQRTEERMRTFSQENEQKLSAIRTTVQQSLQSMQQEQNVRLDEMRKVVDEKMQKVLNERMQQAFSSVNERLEQVYKGLGEMQNLAGSVGDLKKLLSNVKTRGGIGEVQLEALLSDLLPEGQYVKNAKLGKGIVEFAVRMPDAHGGEALLPVDSKFAGDTYQHLQEAYESGDAAAVKDAQKALIATIRKEAQDIASKYIQPPVTTDFGILFLPTEGLYTEAVRAGLPDEVFRKFRIFMTGPTTLAAILSSLRMGFQSVAVQKYSSEVWQVLGEVRTEFGKFATALAKTQEKLDSASDELEKLVGVRTRQMEKRLNNVQSYLDQMPPD